MKISSVILVAVPLMVFASIVAPLAAKAEPVVISKSMLSEQQLKDNCPSSYGTFYPSSSQNGGVYGCLGNDGGGAVCGGKGKDADTCTVQLVAPKRQLPSQAEWQAAARAAKSAGK